MVRDGWLGEVKGTSQVAGTGLRILTFADQRQDLKPGWVGYRLEEICYFGCLAPGHWFKTWGRGALTDVESNFRCHLFTL